MPLNIFPPLESADKNGLLAIGGDTGINTLLTAYNNGIFPWPFNEKFLAWFAPPKRAVLFLKDFHASNTLKRVIKQKKFLVKINSNFEKVIKYCAKSNNRKGQSGTWITKDIIKGYCKMHEAGYAHSIEAYAEDELCGGVYGVSVGKIFAGESMFYTKPNASQVAFFHLIELLKFQDAKILDCQVMTPHSKKFGAVEITRNEFMKILENGKNGKLEFK